MQNTKVFQNALTVIGFFISAVCIAIYILNDEIDTFYVQLLIAIYISGLLLIAVAGFKNTNALGMLLRTIIVALLGFLAAFIAFIATFHL